MTLKLDQEWSAWLALHAERRGVPGATLSLDLGSSTAHAAFGRRSVLTADPVTPRTIFRLGSITKSMTALALLGALRARGLDPQTPVADLWHEFPLAGSASGRQITPIHLLSHSAGLFGDVAPAEDTRTSDALEQYAACADFVQTSPAGQWFSYSNASLSLAARLTELLTGEVWDEGLVKRLLGPLGLSRTGILPWLQPDDDVARGHVPSPSGLAPIDDEPLYRALAPAGSCGWSTAPDLLAFGRTLTDPDETFAPDVARMRALTTPGPTPTFAFGWGLGLAQFDPAGHVYGHDGVAGGQQAFLRLAPSAGLRVALMTNGGDGRGLMLDLFEQLARLVGRALIPPGPQWPPSGALVGPIDPYLGDYAVGMLELRVRAGPDGLLVEVKDGAGVAQIPLRPDPADRTGELFLARFDPAAGPLHQRFLRRSAQASYEALIYRGRLYPRRGT